MARYAATFSGDRRIDGLRVQLTPDERAQLEGAAEKAGTTLSQYVRELCLRRSATAPVVAKTRRNPEAAALVKELTAIGNNLNQLARIANTMQAPPQAEELARATAELKAVFAKVLAL